MLQWGPTCSVGRSRTAAAYCAGLAPLQWGPTCSVGRSAKRPSTPLRAPNSFNGARPVRSGDRLRLARQLHLRLRASMGPDLFGREIVYSCKAILRIEVSFNGARPVRSGDRLMVELGPVSATLLQWGPTCSVGRSACPIIKTRPPKTSFNGARPVRSGDRTEGRAEDEEGVRASMGPDLFGREIADSKGRQQPAQRTLQWGPTCSVGRSAERDSFQEWSRVTLQWGPTCSVGRSPLDGLDYP